MCVLRNYQSYPEDIGHDIDAISENPGQIPSILSEQKVAAVVQAYRDEAKHIYALCRWHRNKPVFILLDVSADFAYSGRVFYSGEEFFRTSRPFKFFRVPAAELEFGAYLIKHIAKSTLSEAKFRRLTELYEENPVGCKRQLARFFPKAETTFIADSVRRGDWKPVLGGIDRLQRELLGKAGREQPLRLLLHRLDVRWRRFRLSRIQSSITSGLFPRPSSGRGGTSCGPARASLRKRVCPSMRTEAYLAMMRLLSRLANSMIRMHCRLAMQ